MGEGDIPLYPLLAQNLWPEILRRPEYKSCRSKVVTEELFGELKCLKTTAGWTLARAINTGVCHPRSQCGIHAGDSESYSTFERVFDPVIRLWHQYDPKTQLHFTDRDARKLAGLAIVDGDGCVKSTRIRCARNLEGFGLAPCLDKKDRLAIESLMCQALGSLTGDLAGQYYSAEHLTQKEAKELVGAGFAFRSIVGEDVDQFQAASGYHRVFPYGRGVYLNEARSFFVWLLEGDHIRVGSMQKGAEILAVFERLMRGLDAIEAALKSLNHGRGFQHSATLGYITCCPSNLGTGLRASVHARLPHVRQRGDFEELMSAQKAASEGRVWGTHGDRGDRGREQQMQTGLQRSATCATHGGGREPFAPA